MFYIEKLKHCVDDYCKPRNIKVNSKITNVNGFDSLVFAFFANGRMCAVSFELKIIDSDDMIESCMAFVIEKITEFKLKIMEDSK